MKAEKIIRGLAPLVLLGHLPQVVAATQRLQCPEFLPAQAVTLSAGSGWTAHVEGPFYLSAVGMTAGPPRSMAVLRGEQLNQPGKPESTVYRLVDGFPEGKWLDCRYGEGGELQISKRVDDRLQRCVVTEFKTRARGRKNFDIVCHE